MGIFTWIVFGLVAGALAKWFSPGQDSGGLLMTMVLGVAGALVGGFLGTLIGFGDVTGFNIRSMVLAVAGSLLLLALRRWMKS